MKYLFIFPFMFNEERFTLFNFCISRIKSQLTKCNINAKILINEIGKNKILSDDWLHDKCDYHVFTFCNDTIFNRAWSFNTAIKSFKFENDTKLILMDTDLVLKDEWIKNLDRLYNRKFMIGWSGIYYLNEKFTNLLLSRFIRYVISKTSKLTGIRCLS